MSDTGSPNLRLLSLNVNGLRSSPEKRRQLFHGLQLGHYDVICLQETHHSSEAEAQQWMQEGSGPGSAWLGPSYWCHYTTASRGVAILFAAHVPLSNISRRGSDPDGRLLCVDFTFHATPFTVATVYAPSTAADRPSFFSQLHSHFMPAASSSTSRASTSRASTSRETRDQPARRCLIVGGDFNCVADRAIDRFAFTTTTTAATQDSGFPELQSCMQLLGLKDTWRQQHPTERRYTYFNTDGSAASRLDRWLTSTSAHASITGHRFIDGLVGDHRGVLIRVIPANGVIQGKGNWTLRASLLADTIFCTRLRQRLAAYDNKHPLSASAAASLFLTGISHPPPPATAASPATQSPPAPQPQPPPTPMPPHPHAEPLNARDRLDGMLNVIYTTAMAYDLDLRHSRRREHAALLTAVNAAEADATQANPPPAALHNFRAAQTALQEHGQREARSAAARAAVVYQDFAEAPTFYFHATHGRGEPTNRLLSRLETVPASPNGPHQPIHLTTHSGRLAAAAAIREFYSSDSPDGLFRPGDINRAAQDDLLGDIDRTLSPADTASCEGAFSVDELHAALRTLPRGKAPGSDGIPYELYSAFWPELGQPLCDALNEAFANNEEFPEAAPPGASSSGASSSRATASPTLTQRQRTGTITIIYKGKGSQAQLGNYRPITLFNTDVKIAAKALALRFSHPLASVVDSTQTAYIPGRWAGDNVICHMEEIDYAAVTGEPGTMIILDFAKAFDRLHRGWLLRCLDAMGFGPDARRWVSTMLAGSQARVAYNGWHTDNFPTAGGVGQGSPLSALLYVAAAQPLAARARRLQAEGLAAAITMPDGSPAPPTHQHADDTTLHGRTPADVAVLFNRAVMPFCEASGARINVSKTKGITFGVGASADAFTDAATGIQYVSAVSTVRHLGVELGADTTATAAARDTQLTAKLHIINSSIATWSRHNLSYFGRVYVARQVLASMLAYHFTFLPPKPAILNALRKVIYGYVKRSPHSNAGSPSFQPAADIATLSFSDGGVRLPDLLWAPEALRAKYASRMLEPAYHPWKVYAANWLGRHAARQTAHPPLPPRSIGHPQATTSRATTSRDRAMGITAEAPTANAEAPTANAEAPIAETLRRLPQRDIDSWGLGTAALISTFDCATIPDLPPRVKAAFIAFQRLHPHRLTPPADLSGPQVLREPLFYNRQITDAQGQPLGGQRWLPLASEGICRVGDLRNALAAATPAHAAAITLALAREAHSLLPDAWRTPQLPSTPTNAHLSPDRRRVVVITPSDDETNSHPTQALYTVNVDRSLVATLPGHRPQAEPPDATWSPCLLSCWSPARSWRRQENEVSPTAADADPIAPTPSLYLVGPWSEVQLDPAVWGCGNACLIQLVVSRMSQRLRVIHLNSHPPNGSAYLAGRPVRPKVWEDSWDSASPGPSGIRHMEQRWEDSAAAKRAAGLVGSPMQDGTSMETASSYAAWMSASNPRMHPRDRAAAAAATRQATDSTPPSQRQPRHPPTTTTADDTVDIARQDPGMPPWAQVYKAIGDRRLPREHRVIAWRLLHGLLPCGAFLMHVSHQPTRATNAASTCSHPACSSAPANLTHIFVTCQLAQAVVRWLCDVWAALDPGNRPPSTFAVIAVGDPGTWTPQWPELWMRLRLRTLHELWRSHAAMQRAQQPASACAIASRIVLGAAADMRLDWLRASMPAHALADACGSWMTGNGRPLSPEEAREQFEQLWCVNNVLCQLPAAGASAPDIRWSASWPVPFPAAQLPAATATQSAAAS